MLRILYGRTMLPWWVVWLFSIFIRKDERGQWTYPSRNLSINDEQRIYPSSELDEYGRVMFPSPGINTC
jgi:hypothetical protein